MDRMRSVSDSPSSVPQWRCLSSNAYAYIAAGGALTLSFVSWCLFVAHGLLGNLLVFLGGGVLTVALIGATVAAWLWCISEPAVSRQGYKSAAQPFTGASIAHAEDVSESYGSDAPGKHEIQMDPARQQELRSMVVQELLHACKTKGPPHSISQHGEYSGWVWTIPASRYDTKEPLPSWPPTTDGPAAVAMKWFGGLKAGRIFLARQTTLEHSDVIPVVEIPLFGCTVRLVTEGLTGKTKWWRKTPLEISHPNRALLAKQKKFYLFCDGSAAKEQWYTALTWAATDDGGAPKTVQDLYSAFCGSLRANKRFTFPLAGNSTESPGSSDMVKEGSQADHSGQDKKRGLFRRPWGSSQKPSAAKKVKASKSKLGDAAVPLAQKPAAFLNPEELDRHWMEAPTPRPVKSRSGKQQIQKQSSLEGTKSGASSIHEGSHDHSIDAHDDAAATGAKSKAAQHSSRTPTPGEQPGSPAVVSHSLNAADGARGDNPSGPVDAQSDSEASMDSPRSPPKHSDHSGHFAGAEAAAPQTVAIEHAVNMLMARVAFDLLRSPRFKQYVMTYVQKKLDDLKVPDYINALQVVDVTFGAGVPHISNLQALASPSAAIWPQALFDLDFTGDVRLVLEAKVDVRDGLAWSSLDKYIKGLEGTGSAPATSSSLQPHAQDTDAAAAVAAAAGAAESEDEAEPETSESGSKAGSVPASEAKLSRVSQFLGKLQLRKRMAGGIRQLAEQTAQSISKMQLRLSMDIKALRGPLCIWVPPPPGDRLWFSFLEPPQLQITASPLVAGRMVKYSYYIARISSFIASKMQSSMSKNMVFPSCGDIKIMQLLALDDEAVASLIPGLTSALPTAAVPLLVPTGTDGSKQEATSVPPGTKPSEGGSTTVMATPTPPTAASALAQALKAQTAAQTDTDAQTAAHSTAQGASQTTAHPKQSTAIPHGDVKQQTHQTSAPSKVVTGPSGATVKATGADPNDPALHGLPDESSAKLHSRGSSPPGGSFSSRFGSPKGASYPSTSSSLVSSPQAAHPLQEDMFTRAVHSTKDKRDPVEAEGVELGTINSSGSIGLAEEALEPAPQPFQQPSQGHNRSSVSNSSQAGPTQDQPQPVSFQSLSALAFQASRRWNKASDSAESDAADAGTGASQQGTSATENQAAPTVPGAAAEHRFKSSEHITSASATPQLQAQDQAGTGRGGALMESSMQPSINLLPSRTVSGHENAQADASAQDAQVHAADAGVSVVAGDADSSQAQPPAAGKLGKTASMEKKWGYPVPTGSSMFERVRSRNYSQEEEGAAAPAEASTARGQPAEDSQQAMTADAGPVLGAAGQDGLESRELYPEPPRSYQTEGLGEHDASQQAAAPPDSPALAQPLPHIHTSVPANQAEAGSAGGEDAEGTPRGLPRRSASQNDASGYAVSPKSWIQQQLKSNPALANKWEAKREDVQQRGKRFASNVFSTFTRAEEKWRQSLQHSKDAPPK